MIAVSIIDKTAQKHKKRVTDVARFLMRKYKKEAYSLDISLVGNRQMKKNVLAYPATAFPRPDLKELPLGEIILNPRYIAREGENLDFMLIHGFLHLLGYDHKAKNDTITMERLERRVLREITKL